MKPRKIIALAVILLAIVAGVTYPLFTTVKEHKENDWKEKKQIAPSGGEYFSKRLELAVPQFFQNDDKWGNDNLGPTDGTLGAEGCAITSISMIFQFYGIDTDPQRLNNFLNKNGGYTPQGWVYWEKAAELAPDRVKHVYEDLPSYDLIDSNLKRANPVIAKLKLRSGINHFVVIAGKDGLDYLIRDPAAPGGKGIYPLKELGSDILGLRFYESTPQIDKIPKPESRVTKE